MSIDSYVQHPNLGPFLKLFELETAGTIFYFTPHLDQTDIVYNGNVYTPLPVELSDNRSSADAPARPKLTLSNLNKFLFLAVVQDDLVGATLTRKRTFQEFLNDPSMYLHEERFIITQVLALTHQFITLQLGVPIDRNTVKLPRKMILPVDYPGVQKLMVR